MLGTQGGSRAAALWGYAEAVAEGACGTELGALLS